MVVAWIVIAAASRSCKARAARAWRAAVRFPPPPPSSSEDKRETGFGGSGVAGAVESWMEEGKSNRTMRSFMCGTAEVATASSVGSVGCGESAEGVKATQAFEWGARF